MLSCDICKKQKFDTRPRKQVLNNTPVPSFVGEYIQTDIFHAGGRIYYTTIDRFSKFVYFRHAESKLNAHVIMKEIFQICPLCKHIMTDNVLTFESFPMKSLFGRLNIEHTFTPIRHSISNSQVERFHRTILEIYNRKIPFTQSLN